MVDVEEWVEEEKMDAKKNKDKNGALADAEQDGAYDKDANIDIAKEVDEASQDNEDKMEEMPFLLMHTTWIVNPL